MSMLEAVLHQIGILLKLHSEQSLQIWKEPNDWVQYYYTLVIENSVHRSPPFVKLVFYNYKSAKNYFLFKKTATNIC